MREKHNTLRPDVRRKFYEQRVRELNALLALGWSPLLKKTAAIQPHPLGEACENFLKTKIRESRRKDTIRSYRSTISHLLRWIVRSKLEKITVIEFGAEMARAFMNSNYLEREISPKTFNNNHTFYVTLWNWFIEQQYCHKNPFSNVKKKQLDPDGSSHRPPDLAERQRIREYLQVESPRFFTFCLLCFHCGIRPKEAFMLKPEHVDVEHQCIVVPGYIAKNKRTMGVAIPDVLIHHIQELDLGSQDPRHYIFSTGFHPGSLLKDSRHSGRTWDRLRKAINLDPAVTMYQLKHAGGEQLSRDGVSEVDLMNHLRHHDLSETTTYTKRSYREGVKTVIGKASKF
jgi:integrase